MNKISLVQQHGIYRPEHLRTTLVVGYVTSGMVHEPFMTSLLAFQAYDASPEGRHIFAGLNRYRGLYVASLRNAVCKDFLTTSAQWLLFLDTDMVFHPTDVYRLLDAADPSDRPIIGGLYFWYSDGAIYPIFHERYENGALGTLRVVDDRVREVAGLGMGFTLIHRSVLEKMRDANPDDEWTWFSHDLVDGRRLGEDLSFCLRAEKLGFKVWGHGGVRLDHIKSRNENFLTFQAHWRGHLTERTKE